MPCLAAASASVAVGSNVAGMRHGPGYVSGKQTKSAPSAAARSIHCTASATLRSASAGECEIGCTTAIRKVIGVSLKAWRGAEWEPLFEDHASQKSLRPSIDSAAKRSGLTIQPGRYGEFKPPRVARSRHARVNALQPRRTETRSGSKAGASVRRI